jgi:small-conductance mechanosensitive channel
MLQPVSDLLNGIIAYIPNALTIVILWVAAWYVLRFLRLFAKEVERGTLDFRGFHAEWAMPTYNIVRFFLLVIVIASAFPYLPGAQSSVFQGISVVLGVLISFGSSTAITNVVSGIVLTYARPYRVGDRISVGGATGDVVEKTLLVTRLKTIKNEEIVVPNSTVLSSMTTNYSAPARQEGLILHATITIGYNVAWQRVHALLLQAAKATPDVETTPEPFVLQTSLNDWHVSYQINAYTRNIPRLPDTQSLLLSTIQTTFHEAGVEIMSPQNLSVRDGNAVAIPPDILPTT